MKESINLNTFADGALQEKFDLELVKVLANMQDPNTEWKRPRELTIKIKMVVADENRDMFNAQITTSSKLAPSKDATTKLLMGMDGSGGYVAAEFNRQIPGQQVMRNNEIVDLETGEVSNVTALYK